MISGWNTYGVQKCLEATLKGCALKHVLPPREFQSR